MKYLIGRMLFDFGDVVVGWGHALLKVGFDLKRR